MNRISNERLDEMLHAGNRDPVVVEEAAELSHLRGSIAHLQEATALYAAAEWSAVVPRRQERRGKVALALAGGAAAIVLALGFPALHRRPAAHLTTAQTAPLLQSIISDEALLNGIRNDLSATVPVAMRPLADDTAAQIRSTTRKDQE